MFSSISWIPSLICSLSYPKSSQSRSSNLSILSKNLSSHEKLVHLIFLTYSKYPCVSNFTHLKAAHSTKVSTYLLQDLLANCRECKSDGEVWKFSLDLTISTRTEFGIVGSSVHNPNSIKGEGPSASGVTVKLLW